ncbi:group III truncated hemoglobin [Phenylobacterium sp. 58.2.17]|uniref:group III truncated hemoglobin n=1 Tax=Phenylobacterium sp. 58.2.17 TaxID=2969306 RepID=UPI0022647CAD|nr:group III truncated hemoglobin [Phenylobacterium sp. 58.2.17]MCX7589022.1 group III truncated hemoglobin [Phenylobacterium sp. 58.2.17]
MKPDACGGALAAAAPQDNSGLSKLRPAPYLAVMHTQVTPENLRELVGRFYGRAREDALIGPVFNAAIDDWDHHLDHIAQFWAAGLLGVGRFTGRPMAKHMRQPITPPMFDRWLALWKEATDETYVPPIAQALQARAGRIAESFKLGMFYRPAEDRASVAP